MTPFSMAGTISPPGSWVTFRPIACMTLVARPTVRYFRFFRSSAVFGWNLNQPSGWHGIGIRKKPTTLRPSTSFSSSL
jgi:hypothetical protein